MIVRKLLEEKAREIITATDATTIDEAMDMMISNDICCLPVLDDTSKLCGIISDRDIFRKIYATKGEYHNLKVGEVMSRNVIVGVPDDDIDYIAGIMYKNKIRHVPIVESGQMIGVISLRDINKTLVKATKIENRYLRLYSDGIGVRDFSADH
jgi:CBS domain-containing protein